MKFTLFTPVFNRAATIERVWRSIQNQTCKDFEWICVDDASTDGSAEKLKEYKALANFPMTVLRMEKNGGKHIAWNRAVALAQGELFVPCDSDDEFDADTLEFFARNWAELSVEERSKASGMNVLCRNAVTKEIVGSPFPQSPMWSDNIALFYRYKVTGEKWGCIRSDVLRIYPFPEIGGWFPESYLWYQLARRYQVLCINRPLRTYFNDQANRISQTRMPRRRLPAQAAYAEWHLNTNWDHIRTRPMRALAEGSNFFLYPLLLGEVGSSIARRIKIPEARRWWWIFAFVGYCRYWRRRRLLTGTL